MNDDSIEDKLSLCCNNDAFICFDLFSKREECRFFKLKKRTKHKCIYDKEGECKCIEAQYTALKTDINILERNYPHLKGSL